MDFNQLEQLVAFADCGTLSQASQKLHISQPSLSRSMQILEEDINIILFERTKNRLKLTPTGLLAVDYARQLLAQRDSMIQQLQASQYNKNIISIGTCVRSPISDLTRLIKNAYPEYAVSLDFQSIPQLIAGLRHKTYHIIILPHKMDASDISCIPYGEEQLYIMLPHTHPLASRRSISFEELDGETILVYSDAGYWYELYKKKLPSSKFVIHEELSSFNMQLEESTLLCFISNYAIRYIQNPVNRVIVPVANQEASVSYYCIFLKEEQDKFKKVFHELTRQLTD